MNGPATLERPGPDTGGYPMQAQSTCSIDGCERPRWARGWCGIHYSRWRKTGDASADVPVVSPWNGPCSIADCDRRAIARTWCDLHYQRWKATGSPVGLLGEQDAAVRFWARVERTSTCWLWLGPLENTGYARVIVNGRRVGVHRWAYESVKGSIPVGLHLDHLCRVPHCVNPDHLEAVTPRENTLRGIGPAAVNASKTHCNYGHELPPASSDGRRHCAECMRAAGRRYLAKRRQSQ